MDLLFSFLMIASSLLQMQRRKAEAGVQEKSNPEKLD